MSNDDKKARRVKIIRAKPPELSDRAKKELAQQQDAAERFRIYQAAQRAMLSAAEDQSSEGLPDKPELFERSDTFVPSHGHEDQAPRAPRRVVAPAKNFDDDYAKPRDRREKKSALKMALAILGVACLASLGALLMQDDEPDTPRQPPEDGYLTTPEIDDDIYTPQPPANIKITEEGEGPDIIVPDIDERPRTLAPEDTVVRPRPRPEFLIKSLVIPPQALQAQGFGDISEYKAQGCGAPRGFDDFWVKGLDHTPFFLYFVEDYKERLQLPESIGDYSIKPHRKSLQMMLGMNDCYETVNSKTYDGVLGDHTQAAVMAFQRENGLEQTGQANDETLSLLIHASAMRVLYNMHVLDQVAQDRGIDTQGVFQKAWHESFFNHRAVSATGADGIGQMITTTFMEEMRRVNPSFYEEYIAAQEEGGERLTQAQAQALDYQHDIWVGSYAMLSHCERLLDEFNKESCAEVYGGYQLGRGGYRRLVNAAENNPNAAARNITRGTVSNGYGHMTARNALAHVDGLIDSTADQARAKRDMNFLHHMRMQRSYLLGPSVTPVTMGFRNHFKIDG